MANLSINQKSSVGHLLIEEEDFYLAPKDFYKSSPNIWYTDLEREFVELIYENANSIEEQQQLLKSFRTLKENKITEGHEQSNKLNSERIKYFLMSIEQEIADKFYSGLGIILEEEVN